jgi:hypothetical protein
MAFYGYRTITIDHTKVPNTDQSNFPVYFSLSHADLKTIANGGKVQSASGFDIVFYSDAALTTKLDYEIELNSYSASGGTIQGHVRIPSVSHTTDTVFYVAYGDASITTSQENKTGVWDSNFKGVYHLPNGSSLTANDSTSNANNGTITGAAAVAGKVDGGASFNGSTDKIDFGNITALNGVAALTLELWINPASLSSGLQDILRKFDGASAGWGIETGTGTVGELTGLLVWAENGNASSYAYTAGGGILTTATWYHVVCVYDGSQSTDANKLKLFVNSAQKTLTFAAAIPSTVGSPSNAVIAAFHGSNAFNGSMDEIRLSIVARSADWISSSYNNQNSPGTFITLGSGVSFSRSIAESVTAATDSSARLVAAQRVPSETVTGTNSASRLTTTARGPSETVTGSDSPSRIATSNRSISESVASSADSPTRQTAAQRALAETVTGTNSAARIVAALRSNSETVTGSDSPSRIAAAVRSISELVTSASNSAIRLVIAGRAISETAAGSDVVSRLIAAVRAPSESVAGASNSATRLITTTRAPSEAVAGLDVAARIVSTSRSITETVTGASDAVARIASTLRTITETTTVSQSASRLTTANRAPTESTSVSDTAARQLLLSRSMSETVPEAYISVETEKGLWTSFGNAIFDGTTDMFSISDAIG